MNQIPRLHHIFKNRAHLRKKGINNIAHQIYSFEACASSAQWPPTMLHWSASPIRHILGDITNPIFTPHHQGATINLGSTIMSGGGRQDAHIWS